MNDDQPIFVRGLSRSGGTLLVTILDAHPDVAMSYEIYAHLLEPKRNNVASFADFERVLSKAKRMSSLVSKLPSEGLGRFIMRCSRSGIQIDDLSRIVREFKQEDLTFESNTGRCLFMGLCCKAKMKKEKKTTWGMKCTGRYNDYMSIWPKARFINIIRDGRDVLASQLNTGAFNKTATDVGKGWVSTHATFRAATERNRGACLEVFYEKLVTEPEPEIRKICDFLEIEFNVSQLQFYNEDLTIHKASHLSGNRVASPIDDSKVGRWKKDLSRDQLRDFLAVAGEDLQRYGYTVDDQV